MHSSHISTHCISKGSRWITLKTFSSLILKSWLSWQRTVCLFQRHIESLSSLAQSGVLSFRQHGPHPHEPPVSPADLPSRKTPGNSLCNSQETSWAFLIRRVYQNPVNLSRTFSVIIANVFVGSPCFRNFVKGFMNISLNPKGRVNNFPALISWAIFVSIIYCCVCCLCMSGVGDCPPLA